MLKCHNQHNSHSVNKFVTAKSTYINAVNDEDFIANTNENNKQTERNIQKIRKKSQDICYTLNFYENYGNIYISYNSNRIFIAKIRKVIFDDNFQELFEKGKNNMNGYMKEEMNEIPDITFWYQRYYYYSRFDEGIKMDKESNFFLILGWWSVTPEEIAKYTAGLCEGKVVADGFCGSGGNVIQFSKFCKKVYAIDIDPKKLEISKNNAKVYECEDNIEFIQSDYLQMTNKLKVDYVFLSPPWGGIKYKNSDVYNIKELMTPNIYDIVRVSLNIAKNIIFFLPRTLLLDELFDIVSTIMNSHENGTGDRLYFDVHVLKSAKKIKALMIIFGHDIKEYLDFYYPKISSKNLQILVAIAKILGNFRFLQTEFYIRHQYNELKNNDINNLMAQSLDPKSLINHFYHIMTEQERIKFKSFNILKSNSDSFSNYKHSSKKSFVNTFSQMSLAPSSNYSFSIVHEIKLEYIPKIKIEVCTPPHTKNITKVTKIITKKRIITKEKKTILKAEVGV